MSNNKLTGTLPDTSSKDDDQRKAQLQINSLDYLVQVDRLPTIRSNCHGVYHYGFDNNYPRKIIQSSERSSSLVTAKNKQAQFVQGLGFPGATANDVKNGTAVVINRDGETLYDLLQFCSHEKANINIAIHVNYNALGEAVELNLVQYDFVRRKIRKKDEKYIKHIITNIWHLENDYTQYGYAAKMMEFNRWMEGKETELSFCALEVFDYNPDPIVVREQIELAGGIENYPGQLFYRKRTKDIYQKAIYDSVADDFQFDAEAKLMSLSNIQNGYSAGGVFKYFSTDTGNKEIQDIKKKLGNTRGASNTGRILTVPIPPNSDMRMPDNMFEPTIMQNIDSLNEKQKKDARENIDGLYNIPKALKASQNEGFLSKENMQEAFDYYNSVTEPLRQELEIELTQLIANSVFANQVKLPIEIIPLQYISRTLNNQDESDQIRIESQARLKGTVGGVQGVLAIQQSVSQGTTQYESGVEILKDIYGYSDERARKILGEPIQQFDENDETIDDNTIDETNIVEENETANND
jgi:hypothetical protein